MYKILKSPYFILSIISVISTLILWKIVGIETIYKNFDGVLYIIPAKTLYNFNEIEKINTEFGFGELGLKPNYFTAHLPLYPLFIRFFAEIFNFFGGWFEKLAYFKSMLFVNLISTIFLVCFFYFLLKKIRLTTKPLILSLIFLFLPRFLVVRSVGAPESLFILLILLSLYLFEEKKYFLSGIFGGLATATKTPGILLFGAYCLVFIEKMIKEKKIERKWFSIIFIPLGLIAVFFLYFFQTGDFLAYFKSGDNIHLVYPFSVFDFKKNWVGTAWLEDVLFYFFLYGLTVYQLKDSKYRSFFYFSLVFFSAILLVQHRDIARYSLPLWPLTLIAFEKFFTSKKFLIIFFILLLGIFLYAINFISYNIIPIGEWKAFLINY